jgi:hypothetical protein
MYSDKIIAKPTKKRHDSFMSSGRSDGPLHGKMAAKITDFSQ